MLKADIRVLGDQDMGIRELGYQEQSQILISRYPDIHYRITRYPDILNLIFVICILIFGIITNAYALNLDKVKVQFLNGDYKSAIQEGEKILARQAHSSLGVDELYYILGLAYLQDGSYLRASDIFEIILKEFKNSSFRERAKLGLADSYFLRGDYEKAQSYYKELLESNQRTDLAGLLYYRLSQTGFKKGDTQAAKEYLDKIKQEFPYNPEINKNKEIYSLSDIYYTVQVGSFLKPANARNLCDKLIGKGYDAYVQEVDNNSAKAYRVKVGRLKSRQEAEQLKERLSAEGYPTRIFP